jgi:hypothetical protein
VVRAIDLLQYLDAEIPLTLTYRGGKMMQRSLDLRQIR